VTIYLFSPDPHRAAACVNGSIWLLSMEARLSCRYCYCTTVSQRTGKMMMMTLMTSRHHLSTRRTERCLLLAGQWCLRAASEPASLKLLLQLKRTLPLTCSTFYGHFLACICVRSRFCYGRSVCLSVCPSRSGVLSRRMKIRSCGLRYSF